MSSFSSSFNGGEWCGKVVEVVSLMVILLLLLVLRLLLSVESLRFLLTVAMEFAMFSFISGLLLSWVINWSFGFSIGMNNYVLLY